MPPILEATPEVVALLLLDFVIKRQLGSNQMPACWLLDLYALCLEAVMGRRCAGTQH